MNRRAFLASLFAPFVARFAPRTWAGVDFASGPDATAFTFTFHPDSEFLKHRPFAKAEIARIFNVPESLLQSEGPGADVWRRANPNLPWLIP